MMILLKTAYVPGWPRIKAHAVAGQSAKRRLFVTRHFEGTLLSSFIICKSHRSAACRASGALAVLMSLAALLATIPAQVPAQAQVPVQVPAQAQVPAALVEDVQSKTANVEFMDYLTTGQVIKLQPREILVLSYLKSCHYETITGGTVYIGAERSDVVGGKVARSKVPCDGGKMQLTFQLATSSAASSYRDRTPIQVDATVYAVLPMFQVDGGGKLIIERLDRAQERLEFDIGDNLIRQKFFDLATINKPLSRGAIYRATLGKHHITFKVHTNAKPGKAPVISRLLRFPATS